MTIRGENKTSSLPSDPLDPLKRCASLHIETSHCRASNCACVFMALFIFPTCSLGSSELVHFISMASRTFSLEYLSQCLSLSHFLSVPPSHSFYLDIPLPIYPLYFYLSTSIFFFFNNQSVSFSTYPLHLVLCLSVNHSNLFYPLNLSSLCPLLPHPNRCDLQYCPSVCYDSAPHLSKTWALIVITHTEGPDRG